MSDHRSEHHDYWDSFYAGRASIGVPEEPSAFARWVRGRLRPEQPVVEVGFGTARDSLWFATNGHQVSGYDFAESAVQHATERAGHRSLPARFEVMDLYDTEQVATTAKETADAVDRPAVYGRFLIHSLEDIGRSNLLALAAALLREGGELYLEFRTGEDRGQQHLFGDDHFRQYLDPAVVVHEIQQLGGVVTHSEKGHGMAVYKTEDPHVARIVGQWRS